MSVRWQSLLLVAALCAAFLSSLSASVARAQCNHSGGRNSQASPGLLQQQLLLQRQMLQQIQQQQLMQTVQLDRQMRELARQGPEALKTALRDPQAEVRLVAVLVAGKNGPALTDDLIERLTDDHALVRQAARRGLVGFSTLPVMRGGKPVSGRSVDFGPAPDANRAAQKVAARKWHTWFERQQAKIAKLKSPAARAPAALAKGIAAAPAAPEKGIAAAPAVAGLPPQR